jgi:hypothetical protein
MRELENKEIGQIRFEFKDGTWFILDHQSLQHVTFETKNKIDFALSEAFEQIEAKRKLSGDPDKADNLNINVKDDVNSKDKFGK